MCVEGIEALRKTVKFLNLSEGDQRMVQWRERRRKYLSYLSFISGPLSARHL